MQHESVGMYKCGWKITISSWKLRKGVCLVCCEAAEVIGFNSGRLWNQNVRSTGPTEHQHVNSRLWSGWGCRCSSVRFSAYLRPHSSQTNLRLQLLNQTDMACRSVGVRGSKSMFNHRRISISVYSAQFSLTFVFFVCVRWQASLSTSQIPQLLSVFVFYKQNISLIFESQQSPLTLHVFVFAVLRHTMETWNNPDGKTVLLEEESSCKTDDTSFTGI